MARLCILLQVGVMKRAGRFAIALGLLALVSHGEARADAASDFTRLLSDYRSSESRLRPSATMPLADQRYLDRYDDDLTPAYLDARRKINGDARMRLSAIDRNALKGQDRLSYDIFDWALADDATELKPGIAERFQLLPINQFDGAQISFAREMQQRGETPFTRTRDYDNAIRRMLGFTRWLDQAIANMREGLKQGVTQPRPVVERMIAQTEMILAGDSNSNIFMKPAVKVSDKIAQSDRALVADSYRSAVQDELLPAYRRLADFLKSEYLPQARQAPGLSAIPGGKDMYLYLVKSGTTTDMTPEAI